MTAQLALAPEGTIAAMVSPDRIVVLAPPAGRMLGELDYGPIDAAAGEARQIAWLGGRLLVVTRQATRTLAAIVEPTDAGVRELGQRMLDGPMTLAATTGDHALFVRAVGAGGATVLSALPGAPPALAALPSRLAIVVAGAAGDRFLIAAALSVDEWDPVTGKSGRRLAVANAGELAAIGGSPRAIWLATRMSGAPGDARVLAPRLAVIPLVHRHQPKSHELPEPLAQIAGDPHHDLLACTAAGRRTIYMVDLDRAQPTQAFDAGDDPIATLAIDRSRARVVALADSGTITSYTLSPDGQIAPRDAPDAPDA